MKDKYKTLITACWIVLICCFIVKLLGGNWFEIACNNEKFIAFCNTFKNGFVYYLINYTLYHFGTYYYFKAVLKSKTLNKRKYLLHLIMIVVWVIKLILSLTVSNPTILVLIIDTAFLICTPLVVDKKIIKRSIIGYILNLGFQIVSLITKNIGLKLLTDNLVIIIIFSIDYYIMVILYYLYSIKEDNNNVSWSFISRFRKRRND